MFYIIITAGGYGTRMKTDIPKQFLPLAGKPILMRSIEAFVHLKNTKIVVVLPENEIEYWQLLCKKHNFTIAHEIVKGGKKRFYSVKNALNTLPNKGIIAVHDGVRPLVSRQTISDCLKIAQESNAAIPYNDIVDSIRKINNGKNSAADREKYKKVATPQVFKAEIIKKAYNNLFSEQFTDDASVVERNGTPIILVKGNSENIKITTPEDLAFAEFLWLQKNKK